MVDRAPAIQRSLVPIHKDLSEMKQMLHECKTRRKPSLHIVDRVRYHVLYKAKLDSFRQKVPAHRKSISEMGVLLDAQTHSERRESIARLGSLAEEQEVGRREEDEAEEGTRELLHLLGQSVGHEEDAVSMDEVLQPLERELAARGGNEEEVNEQLKPIRHAMKLHLLQNGDLKAQGTERLQLEQFSF